MNSKNILILLLSIATLLFLTLTLYFLNENIKAENSNRQLSAQVAIMAVKEFSYDLSKAMTGEKAPDVLCISPEGYEKYLSVLLNEQTVLIYRYIQVGGCRPCYEAQIELIQRVFQDSAQSVVILASYNSRRDFFVSIRGQQLGVPIYHIPIDAFTWQAERYSAPYFFVLHPNMRISNIFVPDERKPELTVRYLESIKRLLQCCKHPRNNAFHDCRSMCCGICCCSR